MTMKTGLRICALCALAVAATSAGADNSSSVSPMQAFPGVDNVPAPGDTSRLTRDESSVAIRVRTSGLDPLSPYTVWAVIFNSPQYCLSSPCGMADFPVSPGHDPRVEASVVYAGGGVADANGRGRFVARAFETLRGLLTVDYLFGKGLFDAGRAEIHVVVRGHGQPAPEDLFAAVNYFGGGCNANNAVQPPCEDQQFAIHLAN